MAVLLIIFSKHLQTGMLDFMWKLLQATGCVHKSCILSSVGKCVHH